VDNYYLVLKDNKKLWIETMANKESLKAQNLWYYANDRPASAPGDVDAMAKLIEQHLGVSGPSRAITGIRDAARAVLALRQPDTPAEDACMAWGEEEHTVGAAWSCKIGTREGVGLPPGADAPMRCAIEKAFRSVTGVDAEFCFSGWSAKLTEPEMAVVENRLPNVPADSRPNPREAQIARLTEQVRVAEIGLAEISDLLLTGDDAGAARRLGKANTIARETLTRMEKISANKR